MNCPRCGVDDNEFIDCDEDCIIEEFRCCYCGTLFEVDTTCNEFRVIDED